MLINSRFCDVCGCELSRPASIITTVGKFQVHSDELKYERPMTIPNIIITLPIIGGSRSDLCSDCTLEALKNAVILDGIKTTVRISNKKEEQ